MSHLRLTSAPSSGVFAACAPFVQVVQNDGLREELRKRQNYITRCIVNSAQLISEKIEKAGYAAGYDWCVCVQNHNKTVDFAPCLALILRFGCRKSFNVFGR